MCISGPSTYTIRLKLSATSSTTAGHACYGYIKRYTVIDKLSLRLGEGEHPLGQIEVSIIQLRHRPHTRHMYFNYMYTTPSAVCLCDNIGLVSLILLGWELHVLYHCTVYKASRSCLLCFLCHPYIPHYNLKNFLFTCISGYSVQSLLE